MYYKIILIVSTILVIMYVVSCTPSVENLQMVDNTLEIGMDNDPDKWVSNFRVIEERNVRNYWENIIK